MDTSRYYLSLALKFFFLTFIIIVLYAPVSKSGASQNVAIGSLQHSRPIDTHGLLNAIKLNSHLLIDIREPNERDIAAGIPTAISYNPKEEIVLLDRIKNSAIIIIYGRVDDLHQTIAIADYLGTSCNCIIYYYIDGVEGWNSLTQAIRIYEN